MIKKIVLINQATGYLFIDIANEFALKYDEVVLLTGIVFPMRQPLNPKIKVVKIKRYIRKSTFTRLICWLVAFIQISFLIKLRYRKHELFISSNPPFAPLLPLFCSNPASLLIYDIYPDALISGKFLTQKSYIIKRWRDWNRIAYTKISNIITLTNGMSELISRYTTDQSKITVIPAWSNEGIVSNNATQYKNKFIEKYNLQNKFLVVYSGNLGKEHELEALIYLAKQMTDNLFVQFLIVGEGWKREQLEELIKKLILKNCLLLPKQGTELFEEMTKAMNLGVVSLGRETSKISIPSKTYNILSSGKPLLCIGSKDSDLAELISKYQIGGTFHSDEINEMTEFIELLCGIQNPVYKGLCQRARKTSLLFTSDNARKIVELVTF